MFKIIVMGLSRYRIQDENWDYFKEIVFFYESFYHYANEINHFIDNEIKSAENRFEKFKKEIEVDPRWEHEWFDHFSDVQIKIRLRDIYYDSLIMTLYSFIEKKLFSLSNYLSQAQNIKVKDIAGNGIFRYKLYLFKVCNIDFSQIEGEWKTLLGFNKLRNQIVHSEGIRSISKSNKELIQFLSAIEGVILNDNGDNTINYHFETDYILKLFTLITKKIVDHVYIEKV